MNLVSPAVIPEVWEIYFLVNSTVEVHLLQRGRERCLRFTEVLNISGLTSGHSIFFGTQLINCGIIIVRKCLACRMEVRNQLIPVGNSAGASACFKENSD